MDGMLSQDEINALLNGVDLSADDKGSAAATTATVDSSEEGLTDVEKDAIGEVANISMGTSATTLYSLVNRKVNITTPVVEMTTWEEVMTNYEKPCVFIQIKYTVGLNGTNILVRATFQACLWRRYQCRWRDQRIAFECNFRSHESDDGIFGDFSFIHAWQDN